MTLACPICAVPEGALMADGVRAGALALITVTLVVLCPLVYYGARLWRAERDDE